MTSYDDVTALSKVAFDPVAKNTDFTGAATVHVIIIYHFYHFINTMDVIIIYAMLQGLFKD